MEGKAAHAEHFDNAWQHAYVCLVRGSYRGVHTAEAATVAHLKWLKVHISHETEYALKHTMLGWVQHQHRKSRKHRERPEVRDATAAMAVAYGVMLEAKPRLSQQPPRRDYDDISDAPDYV